MANHIRRQVREALAAALTGLTTTGDRVKTAHPFPLTGAEVPGLVILIPEERLDLDSFGGLSPAMQRTMQVLVIGYAEGAGVENTLDAMSAEVEAAIASAFPVGGPLLKQVLLTGASLSVDGDNRVRSGELRLTFEAVTRTTAADPTTAV